MSLFFPKYTVSAPGPEHFTCVPYCPEFKQINMWLCCTRDCRPCLHIVSVRCLSATATAFMQKMQERSATGPRCVPGQTQIPCSHLHKDSHTVRQSVQEGAHWTWVWQEDALTDLRFLWDPVVTLRNLARNTEKRNLLSLLFFEPMWLLSCVWHVFRMFSTFI